MVNLNTSKFWEVDGSETQLIIADDIDMQSKDIININDIKVDGASTLTGAVTFGSTADVKSGNFKIETPTTAKKFTIVIGDSAVDRTMTIPSTLANSNF